MSKPKKELCGSIFNLPGNRQARCVKEAGKHKWHRSGVAHCGGPCELGIVKIKWRQT